MAAATAAAAAPPAPQQLQALQPPADFFCPITHCLMQDPVTTADGHVYEGAAIRNWFRVCPRFTSPLTGLPLPSARLVRHARLAAEIAAWRARAPHWRDDDCDGDDDCACRSGDDCGTSHRRSAHAPPDGQPQARRARRGGDAAAVASRGLGGVLDALHHAVMARDIAAVVSIVDATRATPGAQAAGCEALAAALHGAAAGARAAAAEAGAAEAAVAALRAHPADAAVAAAACAALRVLTAAGGGGAQLRAAAAGAPEAVAAALARFPGELPVVESATAALANLSATAWWSGTPPLLRAALLHYPHHTGIRLAALAGLRAMAASDKPEPRGTPLWRRVLGAAASAAAEAVAARRPHTPLPLSVLPPA